MVKRTRWILALSLAMAAAAQAQNRSGEIVQATPSASAVDSLNRNLALLSRNPRDVNALLGAGQAALDLGDVQAANGFYTRANLVNPNLGKVKLGLAIVQIALKQPADAAENFDAAQALGETAQGHLAERGLAYDLTGQQEKAQRDYLAALRANPNDEQARMRYATSLGISGNVNEAESQLQPALTAGDREAWRLRAFIFAMNGRMDDARKVTQTVMPKGLADALDPYMQRLPLLTPEQKASAAHYGEFPSNVLRLAAPEPGRAREVQVAAKEERETRSTRNSRNQKGRNTATNRKAETPVKGVGILAARNTEPLPPGFVTAAPRPPATTQPDVPPVTQPSVTQRPATQPAPVTSRPAQIAAAPVPASRAPIAVGSSAAAQGPADPVRPPTAAAPTASPLGPGFAPQPTPPPASPPAPQASAPPLPSLADALSSLSVPEQERQSRAVVADMAAVARIQDQRRKADAAAAAKAKAAAEAKAKADAEKKAEAERKAKLAANPARIWVQIATGKDVAALAFDLRRLRRTYSDAIGDESGSTAEWGATRRLLVGPYKKIDEARAVVSKIAKAGGDAFVWQSDAGEEIGKIGGK